MTKKIWESWDVSDCEKLILRPRSHTKGKKLTQWKNTHAQALEVEFIELVQWELGEGELKRYKVEKKGEVREIESSVVQPG